MICCYDDCRSSTVATYCYHHPFHSNKLHCLHGGNPSFESHPTYDFFQSQATARGASSPGKSEGAAPAYTESSMDRFNRGGTQVDPSATPYYGSPFRAPMGSEPPVPVPKEIGTPDMEVETPCEPETPVVVEVEPTQRDISDEVSDDDHGDKGESAQPHDLPPEKQLSPGAVDRRLRRIMTPRVTGEYKVPKAVVDQWKDKSTRSRVMSMFEKSGYSPDRVYGWVVGFRWSCEMRINKFTYIYIYILDGWIARRIERQRDR